MITELQSDIKALVKQCLKISWHSRGSIQYDDTYELTPFERSEFVDMIDDILKSQEKNMYKVF